MISARRYHDISCGHRVYGHESKCAHLHGHNYRVHFQVQGALDSIGRVMDFAVIKTRLCDWLETHWDHRFLMWDEDPAAYVLRTVDSTLVLLPFNPTAENMADFLLREVGPAALHGTGITLVAVTVEETAKCSAGSTV